MQKYEYVPLVKQNVMKLEVLGGQRRERRDGGEARGYVEREKREN